MLHQQRICGEKLTVDFYIESEAVIVEVAMSLRNPASEFERDILKAIMAQETGRPVSKLVFLSKPGALKRHASASSRAIITWAQERHRLEIEIVGFRSWSASRSLSMTNSVPAETISRVVRSRSLVAVWSAKLLDARYETVTAVWEERLRNADSHEETREPRGPVSRHVFEDFK